MPYPAKPATTDLPLVDVIRQRWSPRAIGHQPIEEQKIAALFEAARWAPSCYNEQPWRYIYASHDDQDGRRKLESLLVEGNAWAKNAYILMISFTKKTFTRNGKDNVHAMHDLGCASGFITLQATALGLATHQMAGFDRERANQALGVPADFLPGSMMAIGYPAPPDNLSEDQRKSEAAPRTRKDRGEIAFQSHWNEGGLAK